ncbi:MAG: translation initiation factor IF-2 [Candidatus Babeliales bacterium]
MRIYEFSRSSGVPSKQLLLMLRKGGFVVASHMSILGEEEIAYLKKRLAKQEASPQSKPEVVAKKSSGNEQQKKNVSSVNTVGVVANKEKKVSGSVVSLTDHEDQPPFVAHPMTVELVAQQLGKSAMEIVVVLMGWGIIAAKNQTLSLETVKRLAEHYDVSVIVANEQNKAYELADSRSIKEENLEERAPIVVVVGHVDHGKTTLLDFIRETRVAQKERGGITQHLGAYEVSTEHGDLVFIDTPGHAAFSTMRKRGVRVADIVILVVAADDSVMPQTIEAIKYIRAMNTPVVVAINKMDKASEERIEIVKRDLAQHGLIPEEWGGDVIMVPVSAKTGLGIKDLLEMVALRAQLLELKGEVRGFAHGYVLESQLEKGRGAVATVLARHGIMRVGDYFIAGNTFGRINNLTDAQAVSVRQIGASKPVRVAGFEELPEPGDYFEVVTRERYLKHKEAVKRKQPEPSAQISSTDKGVFLVVKADTNSSKEALVGAIRDVVRKIGVPIHVVRAEVGDINENDVMLAATMRAVLVGLHIKVGKNAAHEIRMQGLLSKTFDIIYRALEWLSEYVESTREIEMVATRIGQAAVRKVFHVKGVGVIAGCYVEEGRFVRHGKIVASRNGKTFGEGPIKSLQKEKRSMKEVPEGHECAFVVDGITDWQVGDTAYCYVDMPAKK